MNKEELVKALTELGVKPDHYSLNGGRYTETTIVLEKTNNHYDLEKGYDVWNVFFFERERFDEKSFYTESEALLDIYDRFKKYPKSSNY